MSQHPSNEAPSRQGFHHRPVLLEEVLAGVATVPPGIIVDATLGGGGHSEAVLAARHDLSVLGIDRDRSALDAARSHLTRFGDRFIAVHGRFDQLSELVTQHSKELSLPRSATIATTTSPPAPPVVGALFDLGVSSPQFDRPERGFSYRNDGPLDMRMDTSTDRSAADLVNESSEAELADLLRRNSDERFARRIAAAIVAARPVSGTSALAEIVRDAIPAPARRRGGHPAKRTFQALRIAVNDELAMLPDALDQAIDACTEGGAVLAISYHSGEDRIVKRRFREAISGGCTCPAHLPCGCGASPKATRMRVTTPSDTEVSENPRAASARLRTLAVGTDG